MTTVAGSTGTRPRWNLLALLLLMLYVLGGVCFALSMVAPASLVPFGLTAYADPHSWWPIGVQVLAGLAAFGAYWWPRRREARSFSVLVTGVLAATTILIGLVCYSTCPSTRDESAFWTPLTYSLNLIGGNVHSCAGEDDPSAPAFPLALQLVRMLGPLLLVIAALGIVTSMFRAQSDRLRVRFAASLVVLVGLGEDALPVLRRLSAERESGTVLVVLVEEAGHPLIRTARNIGARVVVARPEDGDALRSLLSFRRAFKVRACYAIGADVAENLRWASALRLTADSTRASRADLAPRLVVRIDDPWQAEYWRRTNAYRTPATGGSVRWMSDSLSVYEVTAALLLDRVLADRPQPYDRLVVVGNSALALALCAELAQREREGSALGQPPQPSFGDLLLFGPDATALAEQHRLRQERFGNSADLGRLSVQGDEPTSENLRQALAPQQHPVLILADDPAGGSSTGSDPPLATYLAALNPGWTIFDWNPAVRGVGDQAIMEQLYPFGLTTEAPSSLPLDSWERAARVVHEQYRRQLANEGALRPELASHQPWESLDAFVKASNVRQITTALAAAESVGRSWGPVTLAAGADGRVASTDLSAAELDQMTRAEHASWMQHHTDHGWRYGVERDRRRRLHPALRPWSELPPRDQQKTRDGVQHALDLLTSLGYRSTVLRAAPAWQTARRRGEVRATRSTQPWTWVNEAGDTMQAEAGHWRVDDGHGRYWSVEPEIFDRTYAALGGDRWRRTGEVRVRPAVTGERIVSLEGEQTARPGDWVIRGTAGEQWLTSERHFAASYELVDPVQQVQPARPGEPAQPAQRSVAGAG